jgi:hypothetical protein
MLPGRRPSEVIHEIEHAFQGLDKDLNFYLSIGQVKEKVERKTI